MSCPRFKRCDKGKHFRDLGHTGCSYYSHAGDYCTYLGIDEVFKTKKTNGKAYDEADD